MTEHDIECQICNLDLIIPYSIPCGHTVCACCFTKLTKCPSCRYKFKNKNKFEPNLLLESFLSKYIKDYDNKKHEASKYLRLNRFNNKYMKSGRYHDTAKKIMDYLDSQGGYSTVDELKSHFNTHPSIELDYIVDCTKDLTMVVVEGQKYVINIDDETNVCEFCSNHTVDKDTFIQLITAIYGSNIAEQCKLDSNLYTKQLLCDKSSDEFYTWVQSLSETDLKADIYRRNSDSDSTLPPGSDSDSDSDSDSGDYGDSITIIRGANGERSINIMV